jgi:hypothetical protein
MSSCYVVITFILCPVLLSVNFLSPSQEMRVLTPLPLYNLGVILHNRPTPEVTSLLIQRRKMIKLNKEIRDSFTRNVSNEYMTLISTFFLNILSLHALSTISLPHSKVINTVPHNCGMKYAYQ